MEKLNIIEIIKRNPEKFKKLYSPLLGNVILCGYTDSGCTLLSEKEGRIYVYREDSKDSDGYNKYSFYVNGKLVGYPFKDAECMLFPSKDKRDWNYDYSKFDPKTLKPFDKVLVRNNQNPEWCCALFSHIEHCNGIAYYLTLDNCCYKDIIPYNEQTKHLLGTTNEPPEYYKYWEFKYYES